MTTRKSITKTLVMSAVMVALGYALTWIEIPMPPPVAFLKLDFSNVPTMLGGFLLGPIPAIAIELIKQLLCWLSHSDSGGVGQLANFIMTTAYVIVPSIFYRLRKGRASVLIGMSVGCVLQTAVSLMVNRFINFPLYMGDGAAAAFASTWAYILAFNAAKSVIISAITYLIYKHLSKVTKRLFGEEPKKITVENLGNKFISKSEADTFAFAQSFAKKLSGGETITLSGELGAGKTVFAKGLAKGLGVKEEVVSPTFTIMNEYESGRLKLYHYDAYRLRSGEEAIETGLADYFGVKDGVCLIEWSENIASALPKKLIKIEIKYTGESSREIVVND